jgi:hypothetical protein
MKYNYSIFDFEWSKGANTLFAQADVLHTQGFVPSFPNNRKQFNIHNPKTGEFRRFRFTHEDDCHYFFQSEDGIICQVKTKPIMKTVKIYIDDLRTPKEEGWVVVRTLEAFKKILVATPISSIDVISFDHDLGIKPDGTLEESGMDCAKFLLDVIMDRGMVEDFPTVYVHSMNPSGVQNIIGLINSFLRFKEKPESCRWYQTPFTEVNDLV